MTWSLRLLALAWWSGALGTPALAQARQDTTLVVPLQLKRAQLLAGNPLAMYAAMLDRDSAYRRSPVFGSDIYPQMRFNLEEFLGDPRAGVRAMSLPALRRPVPNDERPLPPGFEPVNAVREVQRLATKTRLVIYGEEHHLPQTRSFYEPLLRALWADGYRYLAAEAFDDRVMAEGYRTPDYETGLYTWDPVYANAVRTAVQLGYHLIAYDTKEQGPAGDGSFRDRRQAENLKARIFDRDSTARVLIIAGRGHASEITAPGGWTPMASVLKRLTGIDPLTLYGPMMSERQTREEEDPYYRFATAHGLAEPTVFVNRATGGAFGSESFDAYVFWPRVTEVDGRPDWLAAIPGRGRVPIPSPHTVGHGLRLLQAFYVGDSASAIPADQVLLGRGSDAEVLVLPLGTYWLRTIDRDGLVLARSELTVK